jgi:NADPH-dependent 2,4-dienoyl-CoA reductase/sulfur reductase-like enzyme/pSer/pThr/pTyr-binding forkhead associated (FHA) protein
MAEHYMIIGNGIAGVTAAEVLRTEDTNAEITVIADDPFPVYYRPALKDYLAGRVREDKLWARPASFYQDQRIRFFNERVNKIQVGQHCVQLRSGKQIGYSRLLLACGARASSLHSPGSTLEGVSTLRTIADYQAVQQRLRQTRRVVVSGSGTLALETIETLRKRGFEVTHLIRRRTLWSELLDPTASDLVLQQERRDGVDVRVEQEIAEITGRQGQVSGVITSSGAHIPCEMVLIAIGIEPNTDFIKDSGIPCARGVPVDSALRTAAPDVYAAGDILETSENVTGRKRVIGQWFPAVQQARAAAYSMLDLLDTTQSATTSAFYNATFLYGLPFASAGLTQIPGGARGYQEIIADPQPRAYRKVLLRDGIVVGMLALGTRTGALAYKRAIDHYVNLTPINDRLFQEDFNLSLWLDQQGVPPPHLGAAREGAVAVRQAVTIAASTLEQARLPAIASEAYLVAADLFEKTGRNVAETEKTQLSQTRVISVGRQAGVSLLIDHASVSRRHAELSYNNRRYILRDAGSANGTFVNATRLPPGAAYVLRDGEQIRFGKIAYVFLQARQMSTMDNEATVPAPTRCVEHSTGLYAPTIGAEAANSSQPLLNSDGSLLLPGAREAIPASEVERFKSTPVLVAILQGYPRVFFLQAGQTLVLGRDKQNAIVLPDMSASRHHAEIFSGRDGFYARDLGSSNGMRVNQTRIENPYHLAHGDRITIGETVLFFLQPGAWENVANQRSPSSCATCGVVNTQGARFCAHCGALLTQPALSHV